MVNLKERCAGVMARLTALVLAAGGAELLDEIEGIAAKKAAAGHVDLPIFKTAKIGVLKSAEQFIGVFAFLVNKAGEYAQQVMAKIGYAKTETEFNLVKVSARQLTGQDQSTYGEICAAALSPRFGLEYCPPDLAPQLRVDYQDQPDGEVLWMGMEPIVLDGEHYLFCVDRNGGDRWLGVGDYGRPGSVFDGDGVFIFVRPRKVS